MAAAAATGWGLRPTAVQYLPEGGGSFHWRVVDRERGALFVRVDDLDDKPWIGDQRAVVLDGLRRAFATAILLQQDAGLSFVVAPLPSVAGQAVQPLGER